MIQKLIITCLAMLVLTSCASYHARQSNVLEQIRAWEQSEEYGKIFDVFNAMDDKHPQYQEISKLMPGIRRDARKYEQSISEHALKTVKQGNWVSSLALYDEGLDHYPGSKYLESERSKFLSERRVYLDYLERLYQEEKARWLIQAIRQQQAMLEVDPQDNNLQMRLNALQTQAEATAESLGKSGMQAFREQRYATASQALTLSNELVPNTEQQKVLFAIREIAEQEQKILVHSPSLRPEAYKQDTRYLNTAALFEEAVATENWLEARKQLDRLNTLKPNAAATRRYFAKYESAIRPYIEKLVLEGEEQYSKGEFTSALMTWQMGIILDPESEELKRHILRAEQVLQKLKELSSRPPSIQFPIEQKEPLPDK